MYIEIVLVVVAVSGGGSFVFLFYIKIYFRDRLSFSYPKEKLCAWNIVLPLVHGKPTRQNIKQKQIIKQQQQQSPCSYK